MTYRAGDKVTIVLDKDDASELNDNDYASILPKQIIAHEPAPEPVVRFVNVYDYDMGITYLRKETADRLAAKRRIACLRITYDPETKEAKAEVV